jgi:uncharacterized Zn finger protein
MTKTDEIIRNKIVHPLQGTPDEVLKSWKKLAEAEKGQKVHGKGVNDEIFYFNKGVLTVKRDARKETIQQHGEMPATNLTSSFEGDLEIWLLAFKENKAKPDNVASEKQIQAVKDQISAGRFEIFTPPVIKRAPREYEIGCGL